MKKTLIISVGTGTRKDAQESLAHGIAYSINSHHPDKVIFVVSEESKEKTLPTVLSEIEPLNIQQEIWLIKDIDEIDKLYDDLSARFRNIKDVTTHITVDFTSGTKAMTGALTIIASLNEVECLSYVTGKRHEGIVIRGGERLINIQPYQIVLDKNYLEAKKFFDRYQFEATLYIIKQSEDKIDLVQQSPLLTLKKVAEAYSAWDKFDHKTALQKLKEIKLSSLTANKAFLHSLSNEESKEPMWIADLINNAKRRAEEGKYDDAVARLYRTIELIGQYKLKSYGIEDTGDVPREKIPPDCRVAFADRKGKIQLPLEWDYRFLAAFKDGLGDRFINNGKIRGALSTRNNSILAHGLRPVSSHDYDNLLEIAAELAACVMKTKELDKLLTGSKFIKWPM